MPMYDPKFSVKQMYDNYGSSRSTPKTNANKQAAASMKSVGVRGIGSRPVTFPDRDDDRGSTYDVVPQVFRQPTPPPPEEKSTLEGIKEKAVSLFNLFGGDEPKEKETNYGNVYKGPMFHGPITPGAIETRIRDAVDYSKAPPIYYGGIPNEGNMRYDVVPPATANPNLQRNTINRIIKSLAPNSKEYKIKRGDTLSEIAQKEGLKVSDLVKINKIKDKHHIVEGETLIIPASQEVTKVMDLVDSVDPDAQFYQSGVPMEQRIFEPELGGYDEITLPSGATIDKKIKGLGARPEVTVTELDDVGVNNPQTQEEMLGTDTQGDNVDFDFIGEQEGEGINTGYVPTRRNGNVIGNSGVTVGTGVDLGSKNDAYFAGLDESLKAKLRPHYGKRKAAAQASLRSDPLNLTDAEVDALDRHVKEKELDTLRTRWNQDSDTDFDDLPTNQATAVASTYYHHGNQMFGYNYWTQATSGDWQAAADNLRDSFDRDPIFDPRRQREADYLESGDM